MLGKVLKLQSYNLNTSICLFGDSAQADLQFECVTPRARRCGR
jgi:hypothetical protein